MQKLSCFEDLKARSLIAQITDEEQVRDLLDKGCATFYIGFDPTADSLHVGHFVAMMMMARLQRAGHRPIALFGGGTGLIGDPSFKDDMRKMMTAETIDYNISCFKEQMSHFIDFSEGKAEMVNNADWLLNLNYIPFLRDIGVHFSVNRMLSAECYKQRMERGLSFFELNYMIMQSYDFLELNRRFGCNLQVGGDDQWSNILGGVELVRRADRKQAYGLTIPLLLTAEGKKMGKTERGAVWLDREKTSPYDFFQYWRNVDDADVVPCMKKLTFLELEDIAQYESLEGSGLNAAKERLAYELTSMVHSKHDADEALAAAKALFGGGSGGADMPTATVSAGELEAGIGLLDALVLCKLAPSKGEARRLVQQGGVQINGEKAEDPAMNLTTGHISEGAIIIKKGKKSFCRIVAE